MHETRVIGTQTYVSEYAWNDDGLLVQKTYPSGRIVDYARNTRGQVTAVSTKASAGAPAVTVAGAIAYEPFGPVKALTHGNGVTLSLAYDLNGWLSAIDAHDGATPVLDLDYSYDLAGNITGVADIGGGARGRNYAYDALHRLTQGQELAPGGGSVSLQTDYTYDAVGNRTERIVTEGNLAVTDTLAYDAASNRLEAVSVYTPRVGKIKPSTVVRTLAYSDSGNVTVDSLGGSAMTLAYNAADRLVRVSAGGVPLVDYVYAATGQRAVKTTPVATTHYLHDPGGALYAETDGAGTVLREYITLGGATIAIIDAVGMSFVHNDHLATPQVMTDGAAAVVWDASYRPFGEATIAGPAANAQRFPGQYAGAETGYYDNWHRTYDPSLGRYLQSDPIGLAAGFNSYAYANGNPVMLTDPTGQAVDVILDIGFISYDVYRIYTDNIAGSCGNLGENLLALGADTLGAIIPFATGLGVAVRGGRYADDVWEITDLARKGRVRFRGLEVRAVRNLSDLSDETLLAMRKKGFAPRLNGDNIVLHHHRQNPAGPIIEIPSRNHRIGNANQHPFGNTKGGGLTPDQRAAFDLWRQEYWRARAARELVKRGIE